MAEPPPTYVATFKPGSPEMILLAVIALLGAGAAVAISFVAHEIACGEASGDCSGGTAVLVIACAGAVPALGMLVESTRPRGHPWYWFFGAAVVYAFWGLAFASAAG